jgi:hypothetical protein
MMLKSRTDKDWYAWTVSEIEDNLNLLQAQAVDYLKEPFACDCFLKHTSTVRGYANEMQTFARNDAEKQLLSRLAAWSDKWHREFEGKRQVPKETMQSLHDETREMRKGVEDRFFMEKGGENPTSERAGFLTERREKGKEPRYVIKTKKVEDVYFETIAEAETWKHLTGATEPIEEVRSNHSAVCKGKECFAQEGTMQYYRDVEDYNTRLSSKLLARTKKEPGESSSQWVNRVNAMYQEQKVKPGEITHTAKVSEPYVTGLDTKEEVALIRSVIKKRMPSLGVTMARGTSWGWIDVAGSAPFKDYTPEERQAMLDLGLDPTSAPDLISPDDRRKVISRWISQGLITESQIKGAMPGSHTATCKGPDCQMDKETHKMQYIQ